MPAAPLRPCTTPGCPGRSPDGRCGRCKTGRQDNTRLRVETTAQRGYGAAWRRRRLDYLSAHPYCVLCPRLAEIADHHPTSRRDLVAAGDPDPDDDGHLRPLCKPCHNSQTGKRQPGGWWAQTMP
jgi:5-methylcytosine-specific restriction protein A